jgi:aminoglycoside 6'-N-acetyltransferase
MSEPPLDPAPLGLRPLTREDLEMVHAWCYEPHAKRWVSRDRSLRDIVDEYETYIDKTVRIFPYVVTYGGTPIGLVEWERFGDFPDFMQRYEVTDPDAANCDILIGDPRYARRGLGAPLVQKLVAEKIFADPRITRVIIDPEVENRIAIRCYEKAGFRFLRRVDDDGEGRPLYLMELARSVPVG